MCSMDYSNNVMSVSVQNMKENQTKIDYDCITKWTFCQMHGHLKANDFNNSRNLSKMMITVISESTHHNTFCFLIILFNNSFNVKCFSCATCFKIILFNITKHTN